MFQYSSLSVRYVKLHDYEVRVRHEVKIRVRVAPRTNKICIRTGTIISISAALTDNSNTVYVL